MKNEFSGIKIICALIWSLLLLLTIFSNYYVQQISSWANSISLTISLIVICIIVIKLTVWLLKIHKFRTALKLKALTPFIIYGITCMLVIISPKWLHAENYLSKIKYRGCYEGTINTGTIYFRASGLFEYRHVKIFGFTTFEKGHWTKSGDTLFLKYQNETSKFVGSTLLMTASEFINLSNDTIDHRRNIFYNGYCKGLN